MKKICVLVILILLILPSILAINLSIEKQSSNEVLIIGLKMPAVFDLKITNLGSQDNFSFYNLVGLSISPETVSINQGETKEVKLKISPIGDLDIRGFYTFKYAIQGQDYSEISQQLTMKIIDLEDAFETGSEEFDSDSSSLNIYIHNKVSSDFTSINANFKSAFFNLKENFSLGPNEKKSFNIQLNKDNFRKLMAGFYTLNAEINVEDKKANVEGIIKFVEKNLVTTTKKDYGLIINTKI